ncbi:hypothetical protein BSNK01_04630 [Bacillaceae bacterium]
MEYDQRTIREVTSAASSLRDLHTLVNTAKMAGMTSTAWLEKRIE